MEPSFTKKVVRKVTKKVATKLPEQTKISSKKRVLTTKPVATRSPANKANSVTVVRRKPVEKKFKVKQASDEVTIIPGTASLRLVEKTKLYEAWYKDAFPEIVRPLTAAVGYGFIVLGLLAVFLNFGPFTNLKVQLTALLPCSESSCPPNPESTTLNLNNQSPAGTNIAQSASVRFLDTVLVVAGQDAEVSVMVSQATSHFLTITAPAQGLKRRLENLVRHEGSTFTYKIPVRDLPSGEYVLYAHTIALDGVTKANFTGPSFQIPGPTASTQQEEEVSTTSKETTTNSATGSANTEGDSEESGSPVTQIEEDVAEIITEDKPEALAEQPKEDLVVPVPVITAATSSFSIQIEPGTNDNQFKLVIKPTFKYNAVEMYARLKNSAQPTFLGVAAKSNSGWFFWLDSASLPNGPYTILAKGIVDGQVRDVAEVAFTNKVVIPDYKNTTEYEAAKKSADSIYLPDNSIPARATMPPQINTASSSKNPEALGTTSLPSAASSSSPSPLPSPEAKQAKILLGENKTDFTQLLERYGSAVQTGDETMIRLAEAALDEKTATIVDEQSSRGEGGAFDLNIENDLVSELGELKKQVQAANNLVNERSGVDTALDTDTDGVSDFDELVIYETDPFSSDTDQDGFIDGVEIMSGYNPVDAKPEAVIRFDSPKDISYVNEAVLSVKSVTPVLQYEVDAAIPLVQSEIRGFGLPNSFVTLFIYSEPTIVTIRTNDDGSFSYVFSKELEDGEHEVYVALTDNSGEIVMRSNPLQFIKTAEAFTYVDAASGQTLPATIDTEKQLFNAYNLVGAMGVISFGLILLMLGLTVRARKNMQTEAVL